MTGRSLKAILPLCLLTACAASPLMPGGETILLSKEAAPEGCEFIGEVQGTQGNFWIADFTSDGSPTNLVTKRLAALRTIECRSIRSFYAKRTSSC